MTDEITDEELRLGDRLRSYREYLDGLHYKQSPKLTEFAEQADRIVAALRSAREANHLLTSEIDELRAEVERVTELYEHTLKNEARLARSVGSMENERKFHSRVHAALFDLDEAKARDLAKEYQAVLNHSSEPDPHLRHVLGGDAYDGVKS